MRADEAKQRQKALALERLSQALEACFDAEINPRLVVEIIESSDYATLRLIRAKEPGSVLY